MSEPSTNEQEKPKRSWFRFFTKLAIYLAVFLTVIFTVMASLGGNSDTLKSGVEQYLSGQLGHTATIGTLNRLSFFPNLSLDAENITVTHKDNATQTLLSVDKIQVAMGFWDATFNTQKIMALNLEGVKKEQGFLFEPRVEIEALNIVQSKDNAEKAQLIAKGSMNSVPLSADVGLSVAGNQTQRKYALSENRDFNLALGDVKMSGTLINLSAGNINIDTIKLSAGGHTLSGSLQYKMQGSQNYASGSVILAHGSDIRFDLREDKPEDEKQPSRWTGELVAPKLYVADIQDRNALNTIQAELKKALGSDTSTSDTLDFSGNDVEISVDIQSLIKDETAIFALQTPVKIKDATLSIGPLKSDFEGHDLSGNITIKADGKNGTLKNSIKLTNWNYRPLQAAFSGNESVKGRANIIVELSAQGVSPQSWKETLTGNVAFVGGEGHFPAAAFNIWGGGLLNALLPDFDPNTQTRLNCAIADFSLENGLASSNALFIDAKRVTIFGKGEYNVPKDKLNIQLEPKTKSISIGDISAAVNITGPIQSPSFSPSMFSVGKKLGGLLLGTINPAFLAFSLADLSLGENHPCRAYIDNSASPKTQEK